MIPLNYLRKATEELRRDWIPAIKSAAPADAETCELVLQVAAASPKFILPRGARILDGSLRGLPEELRLPFPQIVIEYQAAPGIGTAEKEHGSENCGSFPKRIVLAIEREDVIYVYCLAQTSDERGEFWLMLPYFAGVFRSATARAKKFSTIENLPAIEGVATFVRPTGTLAVTQKGPGWERIAYLDLLDETNAVLNLIEALACVNVTHEAMPTRKANKSASRRGALPFDEYRVLVVNGGGRGRAAIDSAGGNRSPREHLRRGHIRRLQDGRRVWVNSTVVNSGVGGKIITSYDIRERAPRMASASANLVQA